MPHTSRSPIYKEAEEVASLLQFHLRTCNLERTIKVADAIHDAADDLQHFILKALRARNKEEALEYVLKSITSLTLLENSLEHAYVKHVLTRPFAMQQCMNIRYELTDWKHALKKEL